MSAARLLRLRAGLRGEVQLAAIVDTPAALRRMRASLTASDHHAARRFRNRSRRRAFLLGCALLRETLAGRRGAPARRVALRLRPGRRPLQRRTGRGPRALSVSHAGGWVLVAASPGAALGRRIGIDVEPADRVLREAVERRMPWHHEVPADNGRRLRDWTLAEAAVKADGRGLPGLSALGAQRAPQDGRVRLRVSLPPHHRILALELQGLPRGLVGALALASRPPI
ncbi:MAG TPA: hypothetical protein VLA56_09080 [Pseudomonadales bacterium]|nr:hypothetical protein [Pseudomonadales bacterium]